MVDYDTAFAEREAGLKAAAARCKWAVQRELSEMRKSLGDKLALLGGLERLDPEVRAHALARVHACHTPWDVWAPCA